MHQQCDDGIDRQRSRHCRNADAATGQQQRQQRCLDEEAAGQRRAGAERKWRMQHGIIDRLAKL
jgi:hypothetical protein